MYLLKFIDFIPKIRHAYYYCPSFYLCEIANNLMSCVSIDHFISYLTMNKQYTVIKTKHMKRSAQ